MFRGGELPEFKLAYETWGKLNAARSNAVLIFTGLSPNAHAASSSADPEPGWWEKMVGPGKPLNSNRYFIICLNSLGSCKGSTGPNSINPATGEPWRLAFPELAIEDIAASGALLLDALGIDQLHAMVGPSMGGMTALAFLREHPRRVNHLLSISAALAADSFAIGMRSVQRETIVTDPNWNDGNYNNSAWPVNGMRIARKLGMMTYRSANEWRHRFGRQPQENYPETIYGMNFQIESYLEAAAQKFIHQFDPVSYVYLSRAMDWFDVGHGFPDADRAFDRLELKSACIIGVHSDILFPIHQQKMIATLLEKQNVNIEFHALDSVQGHDAFLVDYPRFGPIIRDYLLNI